MKNTSQRVARLIIQSHKYIYIIVFLSFFSCSTIKTNLIIYGNENSYIRIYNGQRLIWNDTVNFNPITSVGKEDVINVNFSDSIIVYSTIIFNGDLLMKKVKVKRNRYIYIEQQGVEFNVFTSKYKRRFI